MKKHYYTKGLMDITDDLIMRISKHQKSLTKGDMYYYIRKARSVCLLKAEDLEDLDELSLHKDKKGGKNK